MAIDAKETKNSLFGGLKKEPIKPEQPEELENKQEKKVYQDVKAIDHEPALPKWQSLDKVTALLTPEQKEGLDRIAKKIMKHRSRDLKGNDSKERITANTLIRALIENFIYVEESLKMEVLSSEEDVHLWIRKVFKDKNY